MAAGRDEILVTLDDVLMVDQGSEAAVAIHIVGEPNCCSHMGCMAPDHSPAIRDAACTSCRTLSYRLERMSYMDEPKPHDKRICRNCQTEIEWASERPEEGWEYAWYHLPVITGRRTGHKRCPIYAEPT